MTFPPKPPPLTTRPAGKPGIPDHLVENARCARDEARAEAELSMQMERVLHRMSCRRAQSSDRVRWSGRSRRRTDPTEPRSREA
jgi:hypothetical protein